MSLPYKNNLISKAKELRKNATPQENHLWYDFLRIYHPRFQRQKAIDGFIADFYCHKAKLVIELDGSQHYTEQGTAYDGERDAILASHGLLILRFSNSDIDRHFEAVCEEIDRQAKSRVGKQLPPSALRAVTSLKEGGFKGSLSEGAVSEAD